MSRQYIEPPEYASSARKSRPSSWARFLPATDLRRLVPVLRWLIPLTMIALVLIYELGLSNWIFYRYGYKGHQLVETLLFGTVGPIMAFIVLELLSRWLDERDTADYQAHLLEQAGVQREEARQLSDDTFQILYATSMLLGQVEREHPDLPPSTAVQVIATEKALDDTMRRLREYLTDD